MLHEQSNKRALPRLELFSAAVDRALRQYRGWKFIRSCLIKSDFQTIRNALGLLNNSIGQGLGILPEGIEFFFNPGDAFR